MNPPGFLPLAECLQDHHARFLSWLCHRNPAVKSRFDSFLQSTNLEVQITGQSEILYRYKGSPDAINTLPDLTRQLTPRYAAYRAEKQGLLIAGMDAVIPTAVMEKCRNPSCPVVMVEDNVEIFSLYLLLQDYSSLTRLDHLYIYVGETAYEEMLRELDGRLEPYLLTTASFVPIVGASKVKQAQSIQVFLLQVQKTLQRNTLQIQQASQQFFIKDFSADEIKSVIIIEPAVNCWMLLGHGLALGFQELGCEVLEYRVTYPPSIQPVYERLHLLLRIIKMQPDCLACVSHSPDLFLSGIEQLPIPRLVWYVDEPDHLLNSNIGQHDYLFYVWNEFEESLRQHQKNFGGEIPVAGFPMIANTRNELQCEVGFVGFVTGTTSIREKMPDSLITKLDGLIEKKLADFKLPLNTALKESGIGQEEIQQLTSLASGLLRRQGMSDEQLLKLFLHTELNRERRLRLLRDLKDVDLKIFGNEDWETLLAGTPAEGSFQKRGLDAQECCDFYRSSLISISIHPLFLHSGPVMRDLDIHLCGGFALSDLHRHALDRTSDYFIPNEEIALYDGKEDLQEKIRFYLDHPKEREKISEAARNRISKEHTYKNRVQKMLDHLKEC